MGIDRWRNALRMPWAMPRWWVWRWGEILMCRPWRARMWRRRSNGRSLPGLARGQVLIPPVAGRFRPGRGTHGVGATLVASQVGGACEPMWGTAGRPGRSLVAVGCCSAGWPALEPRVAITGVERDTATAKAPTSVGGCPGRVYFLVVPRERYRSPSRPFRGSGWRWRWWRRARPLLRSSSGRRWGVPIRRIQPLIL